MPLSLETLEGRDAPAVAFSFVYAPAAVSFLSPEARGTIELAGRLLGDRLNPGPDRPRHIAVAVDAVPLVGRLAEAGPNGAFADTAVMRFDTGSRFRTGATEAGSVAGGDLLTVTLHELEHVLGIGTVFGWDAGSRTRGVAIAAGGAHFAGSVDAVAAENVAAVGRKLPTAIDYAALSDLGWNASAPSQLGLTFGSFVGADGVCRLYCAAGGVVFQTPFAGPAPGVHMIFGDYDYDGVCDVRFVTAFYGFDVIYSPARGLLAAEPSWGLFAPVSTL